MVGSRTSIRGPVTRMHPIGNAAQFAVGSSTALAGVRDSLSTIRDLLDSTDHAVAESIQIQKMASMEHLASGLCHDLNNGLQAIGATIYRLEVASIPEKGSTFEVFLPLQVINEVKDNSSADLQDKTLIQPVIAIESQDIISVRRQL